MNQAANPTQQETERAGDENPKQRALVRLRSEYDGTEKSSAEADCTGRDGGRHYGRNQSVRHGPHLLPRVVDNAYCTEKRKDDGDAVLMEEWKKRKRDPIDEIVGGYKDQQRAEKPECVSHVATLINRKI
jgi:hypothetical protein